MSFLNPFILLGLAAAALPILIHIFTRTKSRTIPFSTLDFLKKLQNEQIRRIKLRQIFLLILRTLIIIFIILAFARPTIESSSASAAPSNANTSMAIIVDNSISMSRPHNGASLFSEMKKQALSVADLLRSGDEAFLITTTDTSLLLSQRSFHESETLKKELNALHESYQATNIDAALSLASKALARSSNVNKEIYLLSDLQRNAFARDSLLIDKNSRLFVRPAVSKRVSNLSVVDAGLRSTILQRGRVAEAAVTIRNTGDAAVDNALVQLYVDNRRAAQTTLQLNPGASITRVFRFTIEKSGFSSARAQLEDDDVLEDNESAFSFYVPEKMRIAAVGEDEELYRLNLALTTDASDSLFQLKRLPLTSLKSTAFANYDVFVLSNNAEIDRQTAEKLNEFVQDGGGIFLALGDKVDIRAYNTTLAPALQLPHIVDVISSADGKGRMSLEKYDVTHPLFYGIFQNQDAEFSKPLFSFAVKVLPNSKVLPIMQYSSGDPFLFERKLGRGVVLVMTTAFDERLSDMSRRTIFAPLMTRIIAYCGQSQANNGRALFIGDELRYKLPPRDLQRVLEIKRPDAKYDRLKPRMTPNGAWASYSLTNLPGIYELIADGSVKYQWAVVIDPSEFDAAPADLQKFKNGNEAIFLQDNTNLDEKIASQRHGRELWRFLALAAFILLITEMLIYREKGETPAD